MVIAVDFDGTICEDRYPEIGKPYFDMINTLIVLREMGHELILWTCRRDEYLEAAVEWCRQWGLEFDAVNSNLEWNIEEYGGDTRKVWAHHYVDDKHLSFEELMELGGIQKNE